MTASILDYSRMEWPADWTAVFGRPAPLLLELGFGRGDFLVQLARDNPGANVLGVEISLPSLRRGAKKIATAGLLNAQVLQGDSRAVLWLLFQPQTISGITINFPDPWPKSHHHHRRLISADFLHLLAARTVPGASLDIATDHAEYAEVIEELLVASPHFKSRVLPPYLPQIDGRRPTKYEQIARQEGRSPRYFLWQRTNWPASNPFAVPEVKAMPHVVLESEMSLDDIGRSFEPFHVEVAGLHIKYLNIYRALTTEALLAEVFISEEPYHQRVGLAIRQRRQGDYVIGMQEIGFPRPTPGIHLAVGRLVAWLQNLDPHLRIVNSTLVETAGSDNSAGEEGT
ncbi:MAG: tRNA (guanosine(46)-N7)-methyltransferase TrmB [Candidatus Promineifilaceae bacterium]